MKRSDIATARLISHQIASTKFTKAKDIVEYMGAMQSQDFAMSKWAVGLRLKNSTENKINDAINKADIIRTHVLRPTWHLVPAKDIYWMNALSAAKIKALMKTNDKQIELTEKVYNKSNNIIAKCFETAEHLDRDTIAAALEKAKISIGKNRLSHLLIRAELEEIICSGKANGDKKTYALLAQRVPIKKYLSKEESLALLAERYFISRGPATIEDFSWWSGLTLTDAKLGLEMIKAKLVSEKIEGINYWFSSELKLSKENNSSVHLLPAFDEFIISYKNREAVLPQEHQKKVLSVNGIFNPVIIVNGQVAGLWKRSFQKDGVHIETNLFHVHNKMLHNKIKGEAKSFGKFLNKNITVV